MIRPLVRMVPPLGWAVLAPAILLTLLGLWAIYTGEADVPIEAGQMARQATFFGVGLLALIAIQIIGYRRLKHWAYPMYFVVLALLIMLIIAKRVPLAPFFPERRNAYRWLVLGPVSIQISDLAKIVLILTLATYLRFRKSYRRVSGLMTPFILTLIPVALILKEPDLGTSLLLPPVLMVMLFAAGAKWRHLLVVVGLAAVAAPIFYFSPLMSEYQRERIHALVRQNEEDHRWRMNAGFQLTQSKTALGSGRFFGQGFREGAFFRHNLLPEEHNDFIFAVVGHQTGFVGCCGVLLCYLTIAVVGMTIASMTNDPFGRLIAVGVCALLFVQAVINVGMTIGLAPITGMSLPFISAGGSSLVTSYAAIGLLISVARRPPPELAPRSFEFDDDDGGAY